MRLSHIGFFSSVFIASGCTSLQSQNVKTTGMQAIIYVVADGSGASKASAQLNVGNNITDFVDLSGGDKFVASAGGQSKDMSRISLLGTVSYEATFSGLDSGGTTYTVALDRTTDVSAPSSTCTMPNPFTISAPTSSSTFSRALDDIVVTYASGGTHDTMSWSAGGDCVRGMVSGTVSNDSGTFTIAKGTLVPINPSPQTPTTCQAHITLTRSRPGQLDSHYGSGGSITAQQTRTVNFSSTLP
jgi:hypothetical protein